MSDTAIRVENLSKRYRIGLKEQVHDTFGAALAEWVRRPGQNLRRLQSLRRFDDANGEGAAGDGADILWALKDVSFEVKQGEVEKSIDTSVTCYSSGMRVCTAFAVAAFERTVADVV